jgi:hypothetical protein
MTVGNRLQQLARKITMGSGVNVRILDTELVNAFGLY